MLFDYDNKTVSYPVDAVTENPSMHHAYGNGVEAYSVFDMQGEGYIDGKPLLYALRGKHGWHFQTDKCRVAIFNRIGKVTDKISSLHQSGIIVLIPNGNELNRLVAYLLSRHYNDIVITEAILTAVTTEELWDIATNKGSEFLSRYDGENSIEQALIELKSYIEPMDKECKGYLSWDYIKNMHMRTALKRTLNQSDDEAARFMQHFNDKDVLLIDDSIPKGQNIISVCNILRNSYLPKSISVLRLFDKRV